MIKAIVLSNDQRGTFAGANAKAWVDRAAAYGFDYVTINSNWYMDTIASTTVYEDSSLSPSDSEMTTLIQYIHSKGLKVISKPQVWNKDNAGPDHWRENIGDGFSPADWVAFFASLTTYMERYATICQNTGVELFMFQTELGGVQLQEAHCRALCAAIRAIYSGQISYCASYLLYRAANMPWWDAVDIPAVAGYFPLTTKLNPTLAELAAGWVAYHASMAAWATETGKSVMFGEAGCCPAEYASQEPWSYTWPAGSYNEGEQANFYQSLLDAFSVDAWLAGISLWCMEPWNVFGEKLTNHNPLGRVAGEILRARWNGYYPTQGWYHL